MSESEGPDGRLMAAGYAWEKFHVAVLGLATSELPLPDRVRDAYEWSLRRLRSGSTDLVPIEVRDDFARLEALLTSDGAASTTAVSDHEARRLIELIVSMYDRLAKYAPSG